MKDFNSRLELSICLKYLNQIYHSGTQYCFHAGTSISFQAGTLISIHFGFQIFFHAGTWEETFMWSLTLGCSWSFKLTWTSFHASFLTGTQIGFQIFFQSGICKEKCEWLCFDMKMRWKYLNWSNCKCSDTRMICRIFPALSSCRLKIISHLMQKVSKKNKKIFYSININSTKQQVD